MIRIKQAFVSIEMLRCSDDFEMRLGLKRVADLADSIREIESAGGGESGLIHLPIVREEDLLVASGEDRIAAHILMGRDTVLVQLVDATDELMETIRHHENVKRRTVTAEEVQELVEEISSEVVEPHPPNPVEQEPELPKPEAKRPRGRPRSNHSQAVEKAAGSLGVSKSTAYRKLKETRKHSMESWGRSIPQDVEKAASEAAGAINDIAARLKALMKAAHGYQSKAVLRDGPANRLYEAAKHCLADIKAHKPAALCPWCKGMAEYIKTCPACTGNGYILEMQADSVPPTLKDPRAVHVAGALHILPEETQGDDW